MLKSAKPTALVVNLRSLVIWSRAAKALAGFLAGFLDPFAHL